MQLVIKDDKLQKFRNHIQIGTEMAGKDKAMFDRYFFAFTQLLDGKGERQTVELLMNTPEPLGKLGQSQTYNVVNGAQEIFGKLDIGNSKKIVQRYIYATRLEEMALKLDNLAYSLIEENTQVYQDEDGHKITTIDPEIVKEPDVVIGKSADVQMQATWIHEAHGERQGFCSPNAHLLFANI